MTAPAPRRRVVVLGGAAAAAAALAALAGCSRADSRYETFGEDPRPISTARATTLLEPVGDGAQALISPLGTWRVRGTHLADRFDAADAQALSGVWTDGGGDAVAPDGEQFLLVRIEVDAQWWGGPTAAPFVPSASPQARARIEADGASEDITGSGTGTYLLRVPEDPSASDAVLVVESDGVSQQLSLIDGTRVSSDVELLYGRHDEVTAMDGDRELAGLYELDRDLDAEGPDGEWSRLVLWIRSIFTVPVDVDGSWPEVGMQFLRVGLYLQQSVSGTDDDPAEETGEREQAQALLRRAVLELDDGTVLEQTELAPESEALAGLWLRFEVPLDVDSAHCTIELDPLDAWDGLADELADAAVVEVDLSFAPGPRSVA